MRAVCDGGTRIVCRADRVGNGARCLFSMVGEGLRWIGCCCGADAPTGVSIRRVNCIGAG